MTSGCFNHICKTVVKTEKLKISQQRKQVKDAVHLCYPYGKKNRNEYEPSSLKGFSCSIDRYLKWHNSKFSLLNGSEFEKYRRVLQSKLKQLKSSGYGNKPNASDELTDTDIDK